MIGGSLKPKVDALVKTLIAQRGRGKMNENYSSSARSLVLTCDDTMDFDLVSELVLNAAPNSNSRTLAQKLSMSFENWHKYELEGPMICAPTCFMR